MLPPRQGAELLAAREKAFWMVKAAGADDVIDMVVPRDRIPEYLRRVRGLADEHGSKVFGCGHAGDGNIHFSVYESDDDRRSSLLQAIFAMGMAMGGAISGEHGIGSSKKGYYQALEDPAKLALQRRIKAAFDPPASSTRAASSISPRGDVTLFKVRVLVEGAERDSRRPDNELRDGRVDRHPVEHHHRPCPTVEKRGRNSGDHAPGREDDRITPRAERSDQLLERRPRTSRESTPSLLRSLQDPHEEGFVEKHLQLAGRGRRGPLRGRRQMPQQVRVVVFVPARVDQRLNEKLCFGECQRGGVALPLKAPANHHRVAQ